MELESQAVLSSFFENATCLIEGEISFFAEDVAKLGQLSLRDMGHHSLAKHGYVLRTLCAKLRRHGMGAEERRADRHEMLVCQLAYRLEHLDFSIFTQSVPRFDFDGCCSVHHHRVEPAAGQFLKLFFCCCARCLNGIQNPASLCSDFLIRLSF